MNLEHLEYFMTVAQTGSINRAAQSLFISQPRLGKIIRDLEQNVGAPLFTRSNHGVTLTPEGIEFQRRAQRVLGELAGMFNRPTADDLQDISLSVSMTKYSHIMESFIQTVLQHKDLPAYANRLQEGDEVLIGSSPAPKAPVAYEPAAEDDERAIRIREFLTGLMAHLQVQASPEIFATSEGGYKVVLQGENLGAIIGRRGETLDAIQQLTSYSINRGQSKRVRVHVDAEGYRAKREESLQRLAVKVAGKVVKYRKNMTLEPMNAYERHVIHTALQDFKGVTTYSTGVEPNRRTVVAYAPHQR